MHFRNQVCNAELQASELVAKGQKMYDKGDRMGALNVWEQALKRVCIPNILGVSHC